MVTTWPDGDSVGVELLASISCFNGSISLFRKAALRAAVACSVWQMSARQTAGSERYKNFLSQRPFHDLHNLLANIFQGGCVDIDPVELAGCFG